MKAVLLSRLYRILTGRVPLVKQYDPYLHAGTLDLAGHLRLEREQGVRGAGQDMPRLGLCET